MVTDLWLKLRGHRILHQVKDVLPVRGALDPSWFRCCPPLLSCCVFSWVQVDVPLEKVWATDGRLPAGLTQQVHMLSSCPTVTELSRQHRKLTPFIFSHVHTHYCEKYWNNILLYIIFVLSVDSTPVWSFKWVHVTFVASTRRKLWNTESREESKSLDWLSNVSHTAKYPSDVS